jgi:ABC-type branched-subunit amino acid transport system permease subunit
MTFDFYISRTTNYYLAAALMFAIYLSIYFIRHSNVGLAMSAVHGVPDTGNTHIVSWKPLG